MRRLVVPLLVLLAALPARAAVPGTSCPMLPAGNVWHADVSALPVHARSSSWLASMSAPSKRLHPDFGPSGDPSAPYGIPYQVVTHAHARVPVTFEYADQSDPGPYPLGSDTPIEGGSDRHALVVDSGTCTLYETWNTVHTASGWTAGSGAVFDLRSDALRPDTWTSADAAGLPILPGLLRLDEVKAGRVDHAIRFTAQRTDRTYVWPARHQAGAARDASLPPMGARFRLKASYPLTGVRADTRVVLAAMRHYGLMLADNGSDWFFQGTADDTWPTALLDELKAVPASAFEAVDASSLMASRDSGAVKVAPKPAPTPTWTHWSPPRVTPTPTPSPSPARATRMAPPRPKPRRAPTTPTPSPSPSLPVVARTERIRRSSGLPLWPFVPVVGAVVVWLAYHVRSHD